MSIPGNINPAPPPSSFDNDPKLNDEGFVSMLMTKFKREPLVPFGCALTVWALVEAMRSMKMRDSIRLNKMFRRRIYAQGFTIACVVAGGVYWKDDRAKERQYNDLNKEQQKQERREAWLKELEARQEEEDELQRIREEMALDRRSRNAQLLDKKRGDDDLRQQQRSESTASRKKREAEDALWAQQKADAYTAHNAKYNGLSQNRSVLEDGERPILTAAMALWRR